MADDNTVAIRRARISNYLDEHITVGLDQPTKIANALDLEVKTVKNDIIWLRDKIHSDFKKYNLEGLRRIAKNKVDRLTQLQIDVKEMQSSGTASEKMDAIKLEIEIMHNQYQLECDGIGVITDEIENRKDKETK